MSGGNDEAGLARGRPSGPVFTGGASREVAKDDEV
jgi:hypothetical protein